MNTPDLLDLQKLYDLSVDLLFVSAPDASILSVNPAGLSAFGYTEEELRGRSFLSLIHPDDLERTITEVSALSRGQTTLLFENRCVTASQEVRWYQTCARVDVATGRIYSSLRDVTNQRSDQERMQRYADLLERTQAELKGAMDELMRIANTDQLTGLLNRRAFESKAADELIRSARVRSPIGVAIFDVDRFKLVNDEHGHPMGDVVLREVGRRIETGRRHNDVVARWGGEEFVALFPGATLDAARAAADRIALSVGARPIAVGSLILNVRVSGGVASGLSHELTSVSELIQRADRALHEAKALGRDRVEVERPIEPNATPPARLAS